MYDCIKQTITRIKNVINWKVLNITKKYNKHIFLSKIRKKHFNSQNTRSKIFIKEKNVASQKWQKISRNLQYKTHIFISFKHFFTNISFNLKGTCKYLEILLKIYYAIFYIKLKIIYSCEAKHSPNLQRQEYSLKR